MVAAAMAKTVCMIVMSRYPNDPRVRREAEALREAGIDVDIFCLRGAGERARESFGSITAYRIMRERDKEGLGAYLVLSVLFTVWATIRLLVRSTRTRYDLIQAHTMPDYLIFCGLFHKMLGRPLVLDLHDLSVELFDSRWGRRRSAMLLPVVAFVERVSCKLADHLISTSEGFEQRLIERGNDPDDITMVLNTADPSIFSYDGSRTFEPIERNARLLYHGTVAERFGLVMAIDALALVRKEIPGATLRVYGKYDPSCRAQMEAKIAALGLDDAVSLGGWKSFEEIAEIIDDSDIGVVPYLANDFMQLALSTKTFEYAASGLPVVASRLDPVTSVFDDDAVALFTPDDPQAMADQVVALCRDAGERARKVERAEAAVEAISGTVMAERYVGLVNDLTTARP